MTVSHHGGHGEVTLPADYVREHVRLGYAATEHGWQSDTVTTAVALASPATTRRGLYVAATRGSEQNVICVVTDSDDVAEARDVLEAVLAVDRADIPAVTQRRSLAEQAARHLNATTAAPVARCVIPDWSAALLHDTKRDVAEAEARDADRITRRSDLSAVATAADHAADQVAAATAPDREAHHQADVRADEARWRLAAAQRRLDAAPRRHRRALRAEVDVAERQTERAERYLDRTIQRAQPSIERHGEALAQQREAHDQLRNSDVADRLDAFLPSAHDHRRRLAALVAWHRWAQGDDVPHHVLRDAVHILGEVSRTRHPRSKELVEAVQLWATHSGADVSGHAIARRGAAPRDRGDPSGAAGAAIRSSGATPSASLRPAPLERGFGLEL